MSVFVQCSKCGKQLRAKDQYAGWPTRCPDCQTINRFPAAPPTGPASEAELTPIDGDQPVCGLCGQRFLPDNDHVKDTKGNLYHRACYEQERARCAAASKPQAPAKPQPAPRSSQPLDLLGDLEASGSLLAELGPTASSAAASAIVLQPLEGASMASRQTAGSQPSTGLYVLIGIGAAVPVLVILLMIVSHVWFPPQGENPPVAAAPAVTPPPVSPQPVAATPAVPAATPAPPTALAGSQATNPPQPYSQQPGPDVPPYAPAPTANPPGMTPSAPAPPYTPPISPNPYSRPEPSPAPPESLSGNGVGPAILAIFACVFFVIIPIQALLQAVTLRIACQMCNEETPSFGKACGVSLLVAVIVTFSVGAVNQGLGKVGGVLTIPVECIVVGLIYSGTLKMRLGKGILIAVIQFVVSVIIGLALVFGLWFYFKYCR